MHFIVSPKENTYIKHPPTTEFPLSIHHGVGVKAGIWFMANSRAKVRNRNSSWE